MTESAGKHKKISLLQQIALIFLVGLILIGGITSYALYQFSTNFVKSSLAESAKAITADLYSYIYQYPAHDWLFRYWYENYDKLDIEYDVGFTKDTITSEKCRTLLERHPEFQLEYAETSDIEALPEEDQKLYAEIVYSWLITRIQTVPVYRRTDRGSE